MSAPHYERADGTDPASTERARGPGELTLTAVVLFALGAYGIAAGGLTGEERAVAVGIFAFTVFAVGVIWPIAILAGLRVAIEAPTDATVGDEVRLRIILRGGRFAEAARVARVEVRVLDPAGPWRRASIPTDAIITHRAARRGVFDHVRVQVRTSAPLGVFIRTRQARVALLASIRVAPAPRPYPAVVHTVAARTDTASTLAITGPRGDIVRSVRPYVSGDAARLVHWPTSARRGSLVVREHDPPTSEGLALLVDLDGPADGAEAAASVAAGIGRDVLGRGGRLLLVTREAGGPHVGEVLDRVDLGRRLAAAIAGPLPDPPEHWPTTRVRATDVGG